MKKPFTDMTRQELIDECRRLTYAPSPVPSIDLLAACKRLRKRWRIQAADKDTYGDWILPCTAGEFIGIWLRSCADELDEVIRAANGKDDRT